MADGVLAIKGGKLIDGTGRPPIENSIILIEAGRFKAVGSARDIVIPADAEVVDVSGRSVLPGFIDGHGHLEDFHGELYLHLGITTCCTIATFQDGPWTLAQKRGTQLGRIRGPRIFMSGRAIGGERAVPEGAADSRTARGNIVVRTAEEARKAVRRKKELGADQIKLNEFLDFELVKAVVEEAHALGMAVVAHSVDAIESSNAGVDSIEHIWSVGNTTILYRPARLQLHTDRLAGKIDQEIVCSYYETENYQPIIDTMVKNQTAWTPTLAKLLRPLSSYAERFRARENEILGDPKNGLPASVRAVTDNAYNKLFKRYTPEELDRAKLGLEKSYEFIRRFVQAGGRLKEGSDPPRGMAALLMHQAMAMDVEAGVPPMVSIQSATLNAAKAYRQDRDYGSVEVGKVADLSIVEGDPLQDIWCTQAVKLVVMDGKVIDPAFTGHKNPIPSFYAYQTQPADLEISPFSTLQNSPTTLRVKGEGMWPFHRVMLKREFGSLFNFNSIELPTKYISKTELEAEIAPEHITEAGTYTITVKADGEIMPESNRAHLVVGFRQ
jgi:imidazolonepropionase-like amidohydrolase